MDPDRVHRVRGSAGALLGGVCFIVPGLLLILALAALFLSDPPHWAQGAAAGAGAAVAAEVDTGAVPTAPTRQRSPERRLALGRRPPPGRR